MRRSLNQGPPARRPSRSWPNRSDRQPTRSPPRRRRFHGRRKYQAPAKRATQGSRRLRSEPARTRAVPVETDSPLLFRQLADL